VFSLSLRERAGVRADGSEKTALILSFSRREKEPDWLLVCTI
jgi:hypothetical protein